MAIEMLTPVPAARRRQVLVLAGPAIGEMILHMFIWIVDTAMVGRLGASALSAVGMGGNVYFTLAFIFGALGMGATAMVARFIGAGDRATAGLVARQAMVLAVVLGLVLGLAMFGLAGPIYALAGLGPEVSVLGMGYTRILSLGSVMFLTGIVANAVIRGTGNTRLPLVAALLGNIVNAAGDYVLIFGAFGFPRLEVQGAAIAAVIGQAVAAAVSVGYLVSRRSDLSLTAAVGIDVAMMRRLGRLSLPAAIEHLFLDGGRIVNHFLVASLGATAFAAHQVAIAAESLSFMPSYGFVIAASILAGQNLGAGRPDEVKAYTREATLIAVTIMSSMGIVFLIWAPALIRLFTPDLQLVVLGAVCLRISAFAQPAIAYGGVLTGTLRGAGDTVSPMRASALAVWLFRIPVTYIALFRLGMGLEAAWVIMVLEWTLRSVLVGLAFARGHWQRVKV